MRNNIQEIIVFSGAVAALIFFGVSLSWWVVLYVIACVLLLTGLLTLFFAVIFRVIKRNEGLRNRLKNWAVIAENRPKPRVFVSVATDVILALFVSSLAVISSNDDKILELWGFLLMGLVFFSAVAAVSYGFNRGTVTAGAKNIKS